MSESATSVLMSGDKYLYTLDAARLRYFFTLTI
jgi:hypothetical protein